MRATCTLNFFLYVTYFSKKTIFLFKKKTAAILLIFFKFPSGFEKCREIPTIIKIKKTIISNFLKNTGLKRKMTVFMEKCFKTFFGTLA